VRLDTIIVADAAANAGGKLSILGAWTTLLRPPSFPWSEPFAVVVRAFLDEEDYGSEQLIEIQIESPDGTHNSVARFEVGLEMLEVGRQAAVEGEQHALVATGTMYGYQFVPGVHYIVVAFNGEEVGRYPLPVVQADEGYSSVARYLVVPRSVLIRDRGSPTSATLLGGRWKQTSIEPCPPRPKSNSVVHSTSRMSV
jgi:hypothetical protein